MLSIVVPAYNEGEHIYENLMIIDKALKAFTSDYEIIAVNDGSRDNTLQVLQQLRQQDPRVNYVDLSRNFGKENAMLAGFDHVTGDCMVIIDADLQHPPTLIPEMIRWWEQGYDDVYAKRKTRGKESWLQRKQPKECSL